MRLSGCNLLQHKFSGISPNVVALKQISLNLSDGHLVSRSAEVHQDSLQPSCKMAVVDESDSNDIINDVDKNRCFGTTLGLYDKEKQEIVAGMELASDMIVFG